MSTAILRRNSLAMMKPWSSDCGELYNLKLEAIEENVMLNLGIRVSKSEIVKHIKAMDMPESIRRGLRETYRVTGLSGIILQILYRVFKFFHTSVWFYFIPYFTLLLSYQIPYNSHEGPK